MSSEDREICTPVGGLDKILNRGSRTSNSYFRKICSNMLWPTAIAF